MAERSRGDGGLLAGTRAVTFGWYLENGRMHDVLNPISITRIHHDDFVI